MKRNSMTTEKSKKLMLSILLAVPGVVVAFAEVPIAQARVQSPPNSLTHTAVTQTGWTESWIPGFNPTPFGISGYDLYINGKKINTQLISGTSYTVTGEQPSTTYQVTVDDYIGGADYYSKPSQADSVTTLAAPVNAATPSISTQPQGATVNEGATSPNLSVVASVSDSGILSYQWYSNTTNSTSGGTAISGATSASFSVPTTSAGITYYYAVVTNTNSGVNGTQTATATSSIAKVVVQSLGLSLTTTKTIIPAGNTLTLEGNVYVQSGSAISPVANAAITLNGPSGGSWSSGGQSTASTVYSVNSNQQGNFSVDWSAPTEPGVYTLSAEANGHKESTSVDVTKYITGAVTTEPITTSTSSDVTNTFNNLESPLQSNSDVEIVIPAGTFSQNTPVWVASTSDASNITPSGKQVVAAVGVNFDKSLLSLQHPITLTISNPNIQQGDVVYKVLSDGSYLPVTANVTSGKAIVTFMTDPNFIVVGNVGGGGGPVPPTIIQDSFTEDAQVGQKYSATVHEIGGTAPMTWSVTNGSLPSGLSLDNQGVISGTPTTPGTYTFTMQVTDGNNLSTTKQLSLTVDGTASNSGGSTTTGGTGTTTPASNPVSLTTATEQSAVVGGAVNIQLQAKGGQPPYTWSVVGTLPKGLSLNTTTGTLSGTPETPGIYQVAVKVAGSQGTTSQQTITLDVLRNYERKVLWNGMPKNVPAIVLKEETSDTTYMPIWYVMQLLKPMGITSTWDGKHWYMTTSAKPNMSNIEVGSGNTGIYLNGTLVQMVNTAAQNDPSANKPTTYMPIWYVMQMLKRVGLQSTWNGTTWTVSK